MHWPAVRRCTNNARPSPCGRRLLVALPLPPRPAPAVRPDGILRRSTTACVPRDDERRLMSGTRAQRLLCLIERIGRAVKAR